jgi:hypothetical protein
MCAKGASKMLTVTDSGCFWHQERHLTFMGEEAEVMEGVLHNLPQNKGCHSYVCEHGHSHRVSFMKEPVKLHRIVGIHQEA